MGVGTNFGVRGNNNNNNNNRISIAPYGRNFRGAGRRDARRAESGDGVLGKETASPSPPTRRFAGAL